LKPKLELLLVAAMLMGCSTPQVALDHANQGVTLTTSLQKELAEFERRQAVIEGLRGDIIKSDKKTVLELRRDFVIADQLFVLSGQQGRLASYRELGELADVRAKAIAGEKAAAEAFAKALDATSVPLPPARAKLAETGKALGALGTELSAAERLSIVTTFLSDVKAEVDKNKKKADDSQKAGESQASGTP
jgi:hypothetical protein